MTTSDDELQKLLLTLSAQFRERLEKELPELRALAQQLLASSDSAVQQLILQGIREQLHKLAGAAGTFGYAELGVQARTLELSSADLLSASTAAQLQAHAQALQLFSQQDCVAQVSDCSTPSAAPHINNSSELNRRIYIIEPDQQLG